MAREGETTTLIVNDQPDHLELMRSLLRGAGYRVLTASDGREAFDLAKREHPGLMISDVMMPRITGIDLCRMIRAEADLRDTPILLVSAMRKDTASVVEGLRAGADEYLEAPFDPMRLIAHAARLVERKRTEAALRESEERLRQSHKLEAMGRLAGGIAHDFNNLLTAIIGYSDLALRRLHDNDPLRRNIDEIKKASNRAASLTHQLLAFSRKQVLQPKVLDLNEVVANMDAMLRRVIGEDIDLVTVLEPQLGHVRADPGQIEQVIMNLVINSRDAMPRGGKLTIKTGNVELDQAYSRSHASVRTGPYVMLAVSDTGTGMDPETQAHIFEPFFTTKEQGKGTGLGLATVYGIVKQSGGNIWVYSEVGRGTTFKIYLPPVAETVQSLKPAGTLAEPERGWETVLLVEDEGAVRNLIHGVLEMNGYTVLQADSGIEAIRICEEYEGPIHLLITDVVMPQMGGRDLAERLEASHPEMRVLYMSGYTDDAIVHHGVLDEGVAFLEKPFTPDSLARKAREVLDAGHSLSSQ